MPQNYVRIAVLAKGNLKNLIATELDNCGLSEEDGVVYDSLGDLATDLDQGYVYDFYVLVVYMAFTPQDYLEVIENIKLSEDYSEGGPPKVYLISLMTLPALDQRFYTEADYPPDGIFDNSALSFSITEFLSNLVNDEL